MTGVIALDGGGSVVIGAFRIGSLLLCDELLGGEIGFDGAR